MRYRVIFICLLLGAVSLPALAVTNGLFSSYSFEVDTRDDVGSNDGTMTNGAAVVGDPQRGNVLSLDGSNDYVSLPQNNMASGRSELTVTMWIKPDTWNSSNAIYDEYGGDYGEYWQFTIREGGWYTRDASTGATGSRNNDLALPAVPVGEWHHLAFVYSVSQSLKAIYLDGSLYTSTTTSVDALTTSRAGAAIAYPCDGTYYAGRIDDLRFYNRALSASEISSLAAEQTYALTVNSGSGDGSYIAGAFVSVDAAPAPSGKGFVAWTGDIGGIDEVGGSSAILTMPAANAEITATYGDLHHLVVNSGIGGGTYPAGASVELYADAPPSGQAFDRWTGDTATIGDIHQASTTIVMPQADAAVTATYLPASGYYLTVKNGTGGGTYLAGTAVDIVAYPPPSGQEFLAWVGDVAGAANVNAPQTTYTMPAGEAAIAASYRDQGAETYEVHQDLDEVTSRIYRLEDKPYLDLIDANGFYQCETLIFNDTETGKEVWSLTRELCTDLANIERRSAWSSNGQYISYMGNKAFWDYRTNSLWNSSWAGYNYIANADTSKRRKLWAVGPNGLTAYQDKFNNWDMVRANVLYYDSGNKLVRVTLGPGDNDTDNTAEEIYTYPNSAAKTIEEVSDWNWLLVDEAGTSPNCYLINLNKDPSDPYFCITYPLAGEVHPGSFRFRRSTWAITGGYENISGGIILRFDETHAWPVSSLNTHITTGRRMDHLWYGTPDDRVGFFGSYNGQHGLYIQLPGYVPVRMANVPDGHVTWSGMDPEWFFAAVGPGTDYQPEYSRRLLACNQDTATIEIICRPWDRSRGTDGGYDKYPRPNQSPDATKCWFHSDMLNSSNQYTGSYIAVFRKPYAPTALSYSGGQLTITPHVLSREVKSYLVYRNSGQGWQFVQEVPAGQVTCPVSGDGTYMVTSLEWSGLESDLSSATVNVPGGDNGDPVSGWDTTPPAEPTNLNVVQEAPGRYRLTWDAPADEDLRYFNIYFSSVGNPQAIQQRRIVSPPGSETEYLDWTAPLGGAAYYGITAVDRQGNESAPAYLGGETSTLTVTNGSGSGDYAADAVVDISADPPASGNIFATWVGDISFVSDRFQADTTITMPDWDIAVTAAYVQAHTLTVNSGTGGGPYSAGTVVDISADSAASGEAFDQWTGDTAGVADVGAASTTYTMASSDAEITATYVTTAIPGDLDGDGFVGQADLDIVLDQWGRGAAPADPVTDGRADANGDGFVGQADLDIVLDHWGQGQ